LHKEFSIALGCFVFVTMDTWIVFNEKGDGLASFKIERGRKTEERC
jgi:hypothetical protein